MAAETTWTLAGAGRPSGRPGARGETGEAARGAAVGAVAEVGVGAEVAELAVSAEGGDVAEAAEARARGEGTGMERTLARPESGWSLAGMALAIAAALALWAAGVIFAAVPLGGALARLDGREPPGAGTRAAPPGCAAPAGAVASSAGAPGGRSCP